MTAPLSLLAPFDLHLRTRVVFGLGVLARLGELATQLGFTRTLLVADHGLLEAGHVERARDALVKAGIAVTTFHEFGQNPNSLMVEAGCQVAAAARVDSIVGLGGGSSMDCAKGINFVLTGGGSIADYRGYGKARGPLLPMIGVPTTTGTGSEGQSYALISDATTHVKMACGDPGAAFKIAILDPGLVLSQPLPVIAASGYDAISHAVETYVTTRRSSVSRLFSREAWRLLDQSYEAALEDPFNLDALAGMQLGAYYAGVAIEHSMLGATHACANPLTAHYGIAHGVAIAALLRHVVKWNATTDATWYDGLETSNGHGPRGAAQLAERLEALAEAGEIATSLESLGVKREDLAQLSADAAEQWTGTFNPRPFDARGAREIYQWAL